MKSKPQILYEAVDTLVHCWYDGDAPFMDEATEILFLPKRVSFMLQHLLRLLRASTEEAEYAENTHNAEDYIKCAHSSTQAICMIALGVQINGDRQHVTIESLTETIRTLTMHLLSSSQNDDTCKLL